MENGDFTCQGSDWLMSVKVAKLAPTASFFRLLLKSQIRFPVSGLGLHEPAWLNNCLARFFDANQVGDWFWFTWCWAAENALDSHRKRAWRFPPAPEDDIPF